jgi:TetR/AcrR family transcriptional regulator
MVRSSSMPRLRARMIARRGRRVVSSDRRRRAGCTSGLFRAVAACITAAGKRQEVRKAKKSTALPRRGKVAKNGSTKQRIVDAAVREFAQNGLRGARMDQIAKRAGINKQLLYHHLGGKEEVYLAALEQVYGDFRLREQELDLERLEPWPAVKKFLGFKFDYLSRHADYVALLMDENMHRGRHVRRSKVLAKMHADLVGKLASVMRRGEQQGVFRRGIDPLQLYISTAALCYFYFGNAHTLTAVLQRKLLSKAALAERQAHIVDFVGKSLLVP